MDYADEYAKSPSLTRATAVEVCKCPIGYTGFSCEVLISIIKY
jgi:hypothetical protein